MAILRFQQLVDALDTLSDEELEELREEIDQELEVRGPDVTEDDEDDDEDEFDEEEELHFL
jgi:hypothetical protein